MTSEVQKIALDVKNPHIMQYLMESLGSNARLEDGVFYMYSNYSPDIIRELAQKVDEHVTECVIQDRMLRDENNRNTE